MSPIASKRIYYPYFDYLRILLASIVMFGHAGLIGWENSGRLAVDVFFALSGWLIGGILLNVDVKNLPRFYFNRAMRIWIPYYIAFFLIVIASLLKDPIDAKWLEFILYKLTWSYNLFGPDQLATCKSCMPLDGTANHFWSVNAEEQFYLLSPLLLVIFKGLGRHIMAWVAIASAMLFLEVYSAISFGVLLAVLNHRYPDFHYKNSIRLIAFMVFLGSAAGLALTQYYEYFSPFFSSSLILLLAIKGEQQILGNILGGMSYPLYLNHWIGVFMANYMLSFVGMRGTVIGHVLATIINYGIALFLYLYIERRVLNKRREWYSLGRGVLFTLIAYFILILGIIYGTFLNLSSLNMLLILIFVSVYLMIIVSYQRNHLVFLKRREQTI